MGYMSKTPTLAGAPHGMISLGMCANPAGGPTNYQTKTCPTWRGALTGNFPNVHWRAVPIEDLCFHPGYESLPPPESVFVSSPDDYSRFNQRSWQWKEARTGRTTTSWAAAMLGIFENSVVNKLGLPNWMRNHAKAVNAYEFMLERKPEEEVIQCLNQDYDPSALTIQESTAELWKEDENGQYSYFPTAETERILARKASSEGRLSLMAARLRWGGTQESIGILSALDYFANRNAAVMETGLLALEARYSKTELIKRYPTIRHHVKHIGLIGASPDGLIRFNNDGRLAAMEVKSHSPFRRNKAKNKPGDLFAHMSASPASTLSPTHVIQIHWHMLCAGPDCTESFLFQTSAGGGVNIFRVTRNDKLLGEMLFFIATFNQRFVKEGIEPPVDFCKSYGGRYWRFIELLARVSSTITVHDHMADARRGPASCELFLDRKLRSSKSH